MAPALSTARYNYFRTPLTFTYVSSNRQLAPTERLRASPSSDHGTSCRTKSDAWFPAFRLGDIAGPSAAPYVVSHSLSQCSRLA